MEMLEIKNSVGKMKNVFNGPTSSLDMAEKDLLSLRICGWKLSKLKSKGKKDWKNETEHPITVRQLQKELHMQSGNIKRRLIRERNSRNIRSNNKWQFH